jgi:hypothetical protein
VQLRANRSVAELGQEWEAEAIAFEDGLRLFGYELGGHYLGDLLQHACDVDQVLDRPRRSDDDPALVVALDFYLDSFHQTLLAAETGTVVVDVGGDERWELGDGDTVATVTAGRFEVFRALGGRRSEAQIRALSWAGAVESVVGLISRYGLPATGLVEP